MGRYAVRIHTKATCELLLEYCQARCAIWTSSNESIHMNTKADVGAQPGERCRKEFHHHVRGARLSIYEFDKYITGFRVDWDDQRIVRCTLHVNLADVGLLQRKENRRPFHS